MKINLKDLNQKLKKLEPEKIIEETAVLSERRAILSTNFSPYEAVILHLCIKKIPQIKIVWIDSGYMLPETYKFANLLIKKLNLEKNLLVFTPLVTRARREAISEKPLPDFNDEKSMNSFADEVKIEPFKRALKQLKPNLWFTALRKEQNEFRQNLSIISQEGQIFKVNPLLNWKKDDLEAYLKKFHLPNELTYFDPSKAFKHRECGLHNRLKL